ncbi:hypothetical protein FOCG_14752 [Fusarium oxysporum f. sp. radicis-lycopersici 26381]|uniref:Uncharacterized protein n=5 Tax=Fusarium oxysporum TaxID=5507 RepID=A0A2H3GKG0_FUSOX|nr:hypothetical protein FOZG_15034 [Fusarium oxysporum Fo47]EXL43312.1 hypothetical protein FOCG_14752 [Fusarium oxysporum f. sp. radicis-lycopersici 26381]PCD31087.1 hypothetical protein AU210_010752 [Fusarium oxysporum f. sp. radicis-cucumerinum]RKK15083.1 hypothetical protein BFJ65_g11627 [Fusarium oxysporum f. sp. cepae]RKK93909.1 hypothetical protein BFJ71_g9256 [Fusarium oxysporum]RYC91029.1 hypothetical protein BFJ63_vAg6110 [Fusarium oxysporum f. sp. narcissi]
MSHGYYLYSSRPASFSPCTIQVFITISTPDLDKDFQWTLSAYNTITHLCQNFEVIRAHRGNFCRIYRHSNNPRILPSYVAWGKLCTVNAEWFESLVNMTCISPFWSLAEGEMRNDSKDFIYGILDILKAHGVIDEKRIIGVKRKLGRYIGPFGV